VIHKFALRNIAISPEATNPFLLKIIHECALVSLEPRTPPASKFNPFF
jgi:hypothetical protein